MSQLILDDQLDLEELLPQFAGWMSCERLQSLRPDEHILDDRVPQILLTLKQPTFVTIDHGFWRPKWRHDKYCILYFALADPVQTELPGLMRRLLRLTEFRTRMSRMGKVARVNSNRVIYWDGGKQKSLDLPGLI